MIKVENLTKEYGEFLALDNVSFEMQEGEVIGVLGPNGAGKTTLLRILVMFLKPTSGKVEIDNLDLGNPLYQQDIKSKIGYLPENAPLYEDMTVWEYLSFTGKMQGIKKGDLNEKVLNVLEKCGLKDKQNTEISILSKGYRQRVGIAQALIHDPKIVILDEPTTGLDPNQRIEIRDLIKEIGKSKTVILSSHVLSEVQATCSRILIINKGKIVADDTPERLENKNRSQSMINVEVDELRDNIIPRLKLVEGIREVEINGNRIKITTTLNFDLRKDIAKIIVEENSGLLELTRQQANLEDVFIELTRE
ncbi:ATP-binding cassette domain-containing protein [Candidatus Parcubacteria bacterium]|nr:ATP-binding cassette domain-containing protein [Candidatus Parcubacteria bacterium]